MVDATAGQEGAAGVACAAIEGHAAKRHHRSVSLKNHWPIPLPEATDARLEPFPTGSAYPTIARDKINSITYLRSAAFDVVLAVWTSLFAIGIPCFSVAGAPGRPIRAATRLWARGILASLRVVVGLGHVERGQRSNTPCLIISNHQSTWETLAFLVMAPDVAIVAKKELLSIPVLGWYLRRSPMIIIDRAAGARSFSIMLEQSREALSQGRSILIFPEGSRKAPEAPIKFKRGAGLLYKHLGVPALPVALNSGSFWGTAGSGPKAQGTITVSYLPIIPPGLAEAEFMSMTESLLEAERCRIFNESGVPKSPTG